MTALLGAGLVIECVAGQRSWTRAIIAAVGFVSLTARASEAERCLHERGRQSGRCGILAGLRGGPTAELAKGTLHVTATQDPLGSVLHVVGQRPLLESL